MTTPQLSYPGVYVQEVPSGSRTIVGVATAVTAFVGRALRGPVDEPVPIGSFGDFERTFGGMWRDSGLCYAVRDYYRNGGSRAVIVRLGGGALTAKTDRFVVERAEFPHQPDEVLEDIVFAAASHGAWANGYAVRLTPSVDHRQAEAAEAAQKAATEARAGKAAALDKAQSKTTKAEAALAKLGADASAEARAAAEKAVADAKADEAGAKAELAEADKVVAAADEELTTADTADRDATALATEIAGQQGAKAEDLWLIEVLEPVNERDPEPGAPRVLESFPNVTFADGPRRADLALESSLLIRMELAPKSPPASDPPASDPQASDPPASEPPAEQPASGSDGAADPHGKPLAGGSDGAPLVGTDYLGSEDEKRGIYALEKAELFTLLCLPPSTPSGDLPDDVWSDALAYCVRKKAFLLVDPPATGTAADVGSWATARGLTAVGGRNAALYFPRIRTADPLREGAVGTFAPSGAVAGLMASTDASRGVWKAPAGLEAGAAVSGLAYTLSDAEHGALPDEVNALRSFPGIGSVVWGARTLRGADVFADDYKFVPVRRLALFLEQSLYRGTQWVVFEPNDEPLWSQVRATLTAFMQDLFRQGAFQGSSPREAYFVHCGSDTTTPYDIARGIVNIRVGFAPLRPAEFVVVGIQQMTASATG